MAPAKNGGLENCRNEDLCQSQKWQVMPIVEAKNHGSDNCRNGFIQFLRVMPIVEGSYANRRRKLCQLQKEIYLYLIENSQLCQSQKEVMPIVEAASYANAPVWLCYVRKCQQYYWKYNISEGFQLLFHNLNWLIQLRK